LHHKRKLLQELINVFLKDEAKMLAYIEGAIKQDDGKELRLAAHAIKGALIHLGGRKAASLAGELESLGKNEELAGADGVFLRFRESLQGVVEEMKTFLIR
jgi:HPt (histidine-containing phosphotransfer) domain-containing protein